MPFCQWKIDVLKFFQTVKPRDGDGFKEYLWEERESGYVSLQKVENVKSTLLNNKIKLLQTDLTMTTIQFDNG